MTPNNTNLEILGVQTGTLRTVFSRSFPSFLRPGPQTLHGGTPKTDFDAFLGGFWSHLRPKYQHFDLQIPPKHNTHTFFSVFLASSLFLFLLHRWFASLCVRFSCSLPYYLLALLIGQFVCRLLWQDSSVSEVSLNLGRRTPEGITISSFKL